MTVRTDFVPLAAESPMGADEWIAEEQWLRPGTTEVLPRLLPDCASAPFPEIDDRFVGQVQQAKTALTSAPALVCDDVSSRSPDGAQLLNGGRIIVAIVHQLDQLRGPRLDRGRSVRFEGVHG